MPSRRRPQAYARKLVSRAMRISACRRLRRKTHAAIPTANAPEPNAVSTITLNVFQIPQPYASFMPLTGPNPANSRYAVSTNASRSSPAAQQRTRSPPGSRTRARPAPSDAVLMRARCYRCRAHNCALNPVCFSRSWASCSWPLRLLRMTCTRPAYNTAGSAKY